MAQTWEDTQHAFHIMERLGLLLKKKTKHCTSVHTNLVQPHLPDLCARQCCCGAQGLPLGCGVEDLTALCPGR